MPLPRRPRDPAQLAKLVVDMATGEVPNDKEQVLAALSEQEQPTGRAKRAKARAASQTAARRAEIARNAADARWGA
jgi:ribosomal protein L5